MGSSFYIIGLALITMVVVVAYLVIERIGVSTAKAEHHHSAATEKAPELRDG